MNITTRKATTGKPKVWSRKGRCPSCDVGTGSKHSSDCQLVYTKRAVASPTSALIHRALAELHEARTEAMTEDQLMHLQLAESYLHTALDLQPINQKQI